MAVIYPVLGKFVEEYALRIPNFLWPVNVEKFQNPKDFGTFRDGRGRRT